VDIESISIGDRVLTDAECSGTKVDEASWAAITLAMPNPDRPGDVIDLHLLRPRSWLAEQGAVQGSLVEIRLEEMQLSGLARVVAIDRVPPLADGPGCLVLSTVTHLNGDVLELRFENSGTVLQPTARHHLHSYDTQDWIAAGDLHPGNRLTTSSGHVTLASVVSKPGLHRVFNIEVETRHAYYVSNLEVFSHNTGACGPGSPGGSGGGGSTRNELVDVLRERLRQVAGFKAEGRPLILDENVTNQTLLDGLRSRGYNVRSVYEIFGRFGTDDLDIIKLVDALDAKVITNNVKDFGRPRTVPLPRPGRWAVETVERLINKHAR
jgi:hypothetical protein